MIDMLSPEMFIRLLFAAFLGGILGLEREIHGRPAGLRTHLLVSLGSAAFMLMSPFVAEMSKELPGDPGRIAAQIVSGIGFLGAGAIVKEGITVRGLTTAACLWVAAAIGMTTGAGNYLSAIIICLIAMIALGLLPYFETLFSKHSYRVLEIVTKTDADVSTMISAVKEQNVNVLRCDLDRDYENGTLRITLLIRLFHRGVTDKHAHEIIRAIEELDMTLKQVKWHPR